MSKCYREIGDNFCMLNADQCMFVDNKKECPDFLPKEKGDLYGEQ